MEAHRIKIVFTAFEIEAAKQAIDLAKRYSVIPSSGMTIHDSSMFLSMLAEVDSKLLKAKKSCKFPYHLLTALEQALVIDGSRDVQNLLMKIQPNLKR